MNVLLNQILIICVALAFLGYGTTCIFSDKMKAEFLRFGLSKHRVLTGTLQILGAIGLIVGIFEPFIGRFSAAGLSLLMLLGFGVRIKLRDSIAESLPSFILMLINGYLCWVFYQL